MPWFQDQYDKLKKTKKIIENQIINKNRTKKFSGEGNVLGSHSSTQTNTHLSSSQDQQKGDVVQVLTNEDNNSQDRRQACLSAAERRGQAWESRLKKLKKDRLQDDGVPSEEDTTKPLVPQLQEACLIPPPVDFQIDRTVLTFNPYEATFSSAGQARNAMHGMGNSQEEKVFEQEEEKVADEPIHLILNQPKEVAKGCLEILSKLFLNIQQDPENEKYQRIRLSNPAIQKKIASVHGSIPFLLKNGFIKIIEEDEEILLMDDKSHLSKCIDQLEVALSHLDFND